MVSYHNQIIELYYIILCLRAAVLLFSMENSKKSHKSGSAKKKIERFAKKGSSKPQSKKN